MLLRFFYGCDLWGQWPHSIRARRWSLCMAGKPQQQGGKMNSVAALDELIQRIGLNRRDVHERRKLLDWQDADATRLNSAAAHMSDTQRNFTERLYGHLASF